MINEATTPIDTTDDEGVSSPPTSDSPATGEVPIVDDIVVEDTTE